MNTDDNGHPQDPEGKFGLAWVLVFSALPLLYVASVGPAAAIVKTHPGIHKDLRKFYRPVAWLHDNTPLEKPLEWWVELWSK